MTKKNGVEVHNIKFLTHSSRKPKVIHSEYLKYRDTEVLGDERIIVASKGNKFQRNYETNHWFIITYLYKNTSFYHLLFEKIILLSVSIREKPYESKVSRIVWRKRIEI